MYHRRGAQECSGLEPTNQTRRNQRRRTSHALSRRRLKHSLSVLIRSPSLNQLLLELVQLELRHQRYAERVTCITPR